MVFVLLPHLLVVSACPARDAGKFSFDRIPEGEIAVSRRIDIPLGNGAFRLNNTLTEKVEIIAGETATVALVGK